MSDKLQASMDPIVLRTLKAIAADPVVAVHGPILKALTTRGLVRTTNAGHRLTWRGQELLEHMEEN